jgi:hypothetical protein
VSHKLSDQRYLIKLKRNQYSCLEGCWLLNLN